MFRPNPLPKMTVILLVVIAGVLLLILSQSNKRTESALRTERQVHDMQHPSLPADIEQMVRTGDRLAAVKEYRKRTGCSFEIAMARIDQVNLA